MKNFAIEIKWAVLLSMATIAFSYLAKYLGYYDAKIAYYQVFSLLIAPLWLVIYFLAIREKKIEFFNSKMDWKRGFVSGIIIAAIAAFLAPFGEWYTYEVIAPNYFSDAANLVTDSGKMTQEQAKTYFSLNSFIMQSIFSTLSGGVVIAAIVAFILKTKTNVNEK
ncbi:MAG: DUF4199 domain-containing protein [Flavobacterium sp.]